MRFAISGRYGCERDESLFGLKSRKPPACRLQEQMKSPKARPIHGVGEEDGGEPLTWGLAKL